MFEWEDPVAVDLRENDGVLEGRGCCGGFQDASYNLNCCGLVNGQIAERRASFGFSFMSGGEAYDYATDVYVSADGQRMAGTFPPGGTPVAWVRIGANEPLLSVQEPALPASAGVAMGAYTLGLADNPSPGSDFVAQQPYRFFIDRAFVRGDLGAFWSGEMAQPDNYTVAVGPVPETAPGLPVALRLYFTGTTLNSVDAAMASGTLYHFAVTSAQP